MTTDVPMKRIRTCEFSGDETFEHDGKPANERSCEHLGLVSCLKHNVPLGEMLMELSPHVPKDLTPEEREIWKRENFQLLYGTQKSNIDQLVMKKTAQSGFTETHIARAKQAIAQAEQAAEMRKP